MPRKSAPPRRPRGSHVAMKRPRATRRRPCDRQAMRATFARLVSQNPRLATAVLAVLKLIASANRQRAMQLIEAVSAVVVASPARVPGPEEP